MSLPAPCLLGGLRYERPKHCGELSNLWIGAFDIIEKLEEPFFLFWLLREEHRSGPLLNDQLFNELEALPYQ